MKLDGYARLYLSGGGLKVSSFLGSLELIDLASLRWIYGLSAGSVLACLLVLGMKVPQLQELFLASEWTRIFSAALHPGQLLSRKGLLDKRSMVAFIGSLLDRAAVPRNSTLEWLRRTRGVGFGCFFLDLEEGRLILCTAATHPRTRLLDALVASCSIPGIFEPTEVQGRPCVDAAFFNNAPLSLLPSSAEEPLLCLVTATHPAAQALRASGCTPPHVYLLRLKMLIVTWMELRLADPKGVTLLEMPETPGTVHHFRADRAGIMRLFSLGRLVVQTRQIRAIVAGGLVVACAWRTQARRTRR